MKRMIKALAAVMVCALMLFMTACGEKSAEFEHGTVSGTSYTSKFLGLKADLGSGWTFLTDSELASANGVSDMTASSVKSAFDKKGVGVIMEMMATKQGGDSVNITVQSYSNKSVPSEDAYFDLIKEQYSKLNTNASFGRITFLGKSVRCVDLSVSVLGVTAYETQIPIFKGDYIACVTFSSAKKENLKSLIDSFKAA
ncbi:MAG: hypothetical protein K2J80_10370 [Oscillospiraceae bacterium]|nr:hypothetical protein [Oscillospiraceae bacterium]